MKHLISQFAAAALTAALLLPTCSVGAQTSRNYLYNEYGEVVLAPAAYRCSSVITGAALGIGAFRKPADLFVDGKVYLADSGNNRVVVLNPDYTLSRVIDRVTADGAEQKLNAPAGVYFRDEILYICDTGNARVIGIDGQNRVVRTFNVPDSDLLTDDFEFRPSKITVNSAGTAFVVTEGIYQGLLQYDSSDRFIAFFGANKVQVTPSLVIQSTWKKLFSDEQRASLVRSIPTTYTNLFIDKEDMIYTATATASAKQVKKLNAAGENILVYPGSSSSLIQKGYDRSNFGDQDSSYMQGKQVVSSIVDVHVDEQNVIASLDAERGKVFLYDSEQNELAIFGGSGVQNGTFRNAAALEKCGKDYLVADCDLNSVTVFSETDFMHEIRTALSEYDKGNYNKAAKHWETVISDCSGLPVAYKGIGRALLLDGNYRDAMRYLKMGDDRYYYSMAIQQYRREYVRKNLIWLLPCAVAAVAGAAVLIGYLKKKILQSAEKRGG